MSNSFFNLIQKPTATPTQSLLLLLPIILFPFFFPPTTDLWLLSNRHHSRCCDWKDQLVSSRLRSSVRSPGKGINPLMRPALCDILVTCRHSKNKNKKRRHSGTQHVLLAQLPVLANLNRSFTKRHKRISPKRTQGEDASWGLIIGAFCRVV